MIDLSIGRRVSPASPARLWDVESDKHLVYFVAQASMRLLIELDPRLEETKSS